MTETLALPFWLELVTASLLVIGSLFALIGAVGLLRLKDYFQRMHPRWPRLSAHGAWPWPRSSTSRGSRKRPSCTPG